MKAICVHSRIAVFATAIVLLLNVPAALAADQSEKADRDDRGAVVIAFTKWVVDDSALPYPMVGYIGGDANNRRFAGDVLEQHVSPTFGILRLEAIYQVQAGHRTFTALIQGGASAATGIGILDGVVLNGWRTGARVHVEFQAVGCPEAPSGTCFRDTIHVERDSQREFQHQE
jgi:hypothetical protein